MDILPIIERVRSIFGINKAELKVIQYLAEKGGGSVKDIAEGIHKSERIVRSYLNHLTSTNLVYKKIIITKNKKLAYFYTLSPQIQEVVRKKLEELANSIF